MGKWWIGLSKWICQNFPHTIVVIKGNLFVLPILFMLHILLGKEVLVD